MTNGISNVLQTGTDHTCIIYPAQLGRKLKVCTVAQKRNYDLSKEAQIAIS